MSGKKSLIMMGDFETTVYEGQTDTEVWASALVELNTEDVKIFHSIDETYEYIISLNRSVIIYYHNLKFDGAYWLSFILNTLKYKVALAYCEEDEKTGVTAEWLKQNKMENKTFMYSISDTGQWYSITIRVNNRTITIRDSYKLLPFTVQRIGKSFQTRHKKSQMEYEGLRFAGCNITEEEKHYIANDVLVVKEALEILFSQGHNKLTIGSCCLSEFRLIYGTEQYDIDFPNLYELKIDKSLYDAETAGDYIRKSYRGGWCYLVKGKENKIYHNGTTADVNSLYPSMMHSQSGNYYPIGYPTFWKGNYIPDEALSKDFFGRDDTQPWFQRRYYFVRVKTRFYIRRNRLPFIQQKSSFMYAATESLETSDVYDPITKKYYDKYWGVDGELKDTHMVITLTQTDYQLLKEQYRLVDFQILDGCWFEARQALFDEYIDKYKQIKMTSKGAVRELAKLFLNNLYGKMATNTDSSFKLARTKEDGSLTFIPVKENNKKPGYIPIGSAITSYSRNFTIRAAQANYHGKDKPGFIYADTDSIHCDLPPEELKGITPHDTEFCCWKLESCWDTAIFTRQKTYIEHITHENLKPIDNPYYNIKCAGMPEKCKNLFLLTFDPTEDEVEEYQRTKDKLKPEEKEFLSNYHTLSDFKVGLKIPGKLIPRQIPGGVLLKETTYEMR